MPIIEENIIKNIYEKANIADSLGNLHNTMSPDNSKQEVDFDLIIDQNTINIQPVQRIYYESKELRGKKDSSGKVAKHDFLILKDMYRGGRGKAIHESEYTVYKEHELFDEIQVDAAWSGVIVWRRIGLEYAGKDTENNITRNFLIPYLMEIKNLSDTEFDSAMEKVKQKGLKADIEIMQYRMPLAEIISLFPTIATQIYQHYHIFYGAAPDAHDVEFNLSDYIRFQSIAYPEYKSYQTVAMYRKVA